MRDAMRPGLQLAFARQLSEENQKRGLEEIALFGELLDRIAAIEEDAFVAVDEGDPAAACRRVHERGIVGHHPEIVFGDLDLPEVRRADGAFGNRQLVLLTGAVIGDRQGLWHVCQLNVVFRLRIRRGRGISRHSILAGQPGAQVRELAPLTAEGSPLRIDRVATAIGAARLRHC